MTGSPKGRQPNLPDNDGDDEHPPHGGADAEGRDGGGGGGEAPKVFPQEVCQVNMKFHDIESKRAQKLVIKEVYALVPGVPQYLDRSDAAISFDQSDHLDYIPYPAKSALVLDLIIGGSWLTKVLMDGGSGMNILYGNNEKAEDPSLSPQAAFDVF